MADRKLILEVGAKDNATRVLDSIGASGKSAGESITWGFIKAQAAIGLLKGAARMVVGFFRDITVGAADQGDEIYTLSQRYGVAAETLSAWGYAARLSGTSLDQVAVGLKALTRNAYEAEDGQGKAADAFAELGVRVTDAGGRLRPAEDLMLDIADALKAVDDESRRAALAQEVFGRSGEALVPMLMEGREGLQKMTEEAKRMGVTWTEEQARLADGFNDAKEKIGAAVVGVKNAIAVNLFPALTTALDGLAEMVAENRDKIAGAITSMVENAIPALLDFAGVVVRSASSIADALASVVRNWEAVKASFDIATDFDPFGFFSDETFPFPEITKQAQAAAPAVNTAADAFDRWANSIRSVMEASRKEREKRKALGGFDPNSVINVRPEDVLPAPTWDGADPVAYVAELQRIAAEFERAAAPIREFSNAAEEGETATAAVADAAKKATPQVEGLTNAVKPGTAWQQFVSGARAATAEAERFGTFMRELGQTVVYGATQGITGFFDAIVFGSARAGDAFRSMAMEMLRMIQHLAMQRLVGQIFDQILPSIPGMAEGGIVTRPTVALIGEAGPEAVVPLRSAKGSGGGGIGDITINQTIVAQPGMDEKRIGDYAAESVLRRLRSSAGFRSEFRRGTGGAL